jgi:hypothetical protein
MKTAAKKRAPIARAITLPQKASLVPRIEVLIKDVCAASRDDRIAALEVWESAIDAHLDRVAEETRPANIPGPWVRLQFDARGYGNNPTRALIWASRSASAEGKTNA